MAHRYPPGYRNNHRAVLDSGELAGTLAERFADLFPATWHDKSGQRWTFSGLNTRFRACRYAAGESFGIHRDGAQARGECRTFLTVMLYLNDASGFGGGATHFYTSKARTERLATVTPREGLAIVFPHELWHEGEEVRSGHKYVLRTDVVYQRPRPEQDAPGHRGYVWDAATLPGGGAVTVGRDGNIIHWSDALAVRRSISLPGEAPTAVAALHDGAVFVGDRRGRVFDATGAPRLLAELDAAILAIRPWSDGALVADAAGRATALDRRGVLRARWSAPVACDGVAPWQWAIATSGRSVWVGHGDAVTELVGVRLKPQRTHSMPATVRALAVDTHNGVAVGLEDGRVLRMADSTVHDVGRHTGAVRSVAWLRGGLMASGGEDNHVRIWDRDGEVQSWTHDDFVTRVLPLGDREVLSTSYDETVRSVRFG